MKIRKTLAYGAIVATMAVAPLSLATASATAAPCGFYTAGDSAFYQHCGDNFVTVKVDNWNDQNEWTYCAAPWSTEYLGSTSVVSWAHFARTEC